MIISYRICMIFLVINLHVNNRYIIKLHDKCRNTRYRPYNKYECNTNMHYTLWKGSSSESVLLGHHNLVDQTEDSEINWQLRWVAGNYWFARPRSSYKQTLAHKLKNTLIYGSHLRKNWFLVQWTITLLYFRGWLSLSVFMWTGSFLLWVLMNQAVHSNYITEQVQTRLYKQNRGVNICKRQQ